MGKGVVAAEAQDVAGAKAGEVAAAVEFDEAVFTDFFEGDVFDGVTVGDTGRQWFLPMAVDLLAWAAVSVSTRSRRPLRKWIIVSAVVRDNE